MWFRRWVHWSIFPMGWGLFSPCSTMLLQAVYAAHSQAQASFNSPFDPWATGLQFPYQVLGWLLTCWVWWRLGQLRQDTARLSLQAWVAGALHTYRGRAGRGCTQIGIGQNEPFPLAWGQCPRRI